MRHSRRTGALVGLCLLTLIAGIVGDAGAAAGAADNRPRRDYRYHYVSLDNAIPAGGTFASYFKVTDSGRVYGTSYSCGPVTCDPSIVVYSKGATTVLRSGAVGYSANNDGVVGGSVVTDPVNFIEQAALFDGNSVQLIPRAAGESTSHVVKVTDSGIALVSSVNATTRATSFYEYRKERAVRLNLGSDQVAVLDINDRGTVAGYFFLSPQNRFRAFRYSPPSGPPQLLDPLPTEPDSVGEAINNHNDVLGYSFIGGALERVGYWHKGKFSTSFVEGTPTYPTVSNQLLWNKSGLIVITQSRNDGNSYIVPDPGVRLKIADLTTGLPLWTNVVDVNNNGDLLGTGGPAFATVDHTFLLERNRESYSQPTIGTPSRCEPCSSQF